MIDFTPYAEFFNDEWQSMLDSVDAEWSWDRKACYLYLTSTGVTTMPKGTPRAGRKPSLNKMAANLIAAMNFLSLVPDKNNTVVINGPLASVNNGVVKAGIMISDDFPGDTVAKMILAPFVGALSRVGKDLEIGWGDDFVTLTTTGFEATIPNMGISVDDRANPDPNIAPLNNEFREAVAKVMRLTSDTAEELMTASIAVTGPTVMSTKRHTFLEAWHGNDMPFGAIFFPKQFAQAFVKTKTNVVGFGFGPTSFTVYFEGGAYMQTNTYQNAWMVPGNANPSYVFDRINTLLADDPEGTMIDSRERLTAAIKAVFAVSQEDQWFSIGRIETVDAIATLDEASINTEFLMKPDRYLAVADLVTAVKVARDNGMPRLMFWGDKVRGCLTIDLHPHPPTRAAVPDPTEPQPAAAPAGWGAPSQGFGQAPAPATSTALATSAGLGWGSPAATGEPLATSGPTVFPSSSGGFIFGGDDE